MKRFVVLYLAPLTVAQRFAQATPEEAMVGMKQWAQWQNKVGKHLVHMGKPLGQALRVTQAGVAPSDSQVTGMSILEARSTDEALSLVKDHHFLGWAEGCTIDLLEEMPIPEQVAGLV